MNIFPKTAKIATVFILLVLFNLSSGKNKYNSFGIYLSQDDCLILSDTDIEAYVKAEHKIILNSQGISKWNSYIKNDSILNKQGSNWNSYIKYDPNQTPPIPKLTRKLYQDDFSLRLDSETIYTGKFWSFASSQSYYGIVILDVFFPLDSLHNWISIRYWNPKTPMYDLRNSNKIFDFFASKGKLR